MSSVMKDHGLSDEMIGRWIAIDEIFRKDITKDHPVPRVVDGVAQPLDGYEVLTIEVSTLCDGCGGEISEGEIVRYHVRLGLTYCHKCIANRITQHE
jgi:hypothetical protein